MDTLGAFASQYAATNTHRVSDRRLREIRDSRVPVMVLRGDEDHLYERTFVRVAFFLLAYFLDLVFMLSLLVILLFSFFYSSILDNKMQTSAARAAREA